VAVVAQFLQLAEEAQTTKGGRMISDESMNRLVEAGVLRGKMEMISALRSWLNTKEAEVINVVDEKLDDVKERERNTNGRTDILGQPDTERAS
jgi:hypothetical protein